MTSLGEDIQERLQVWRIVNYTKLAPGYTGFIGICFENLLRALLAGPLWINEVGAVQ